VMRASDPRFARTAASAARRRTRLTPALAASAEMLTTMGAAISVRSCLKRDD
jgi:hypothetical protein